MWVGDGEIWEEATEPTGCFLTAARVKRPLRFADSLRLAVSHLCQVQARPATVAAAQSGGEFQPRATAVRPRRYYTVCEKQLFRVFCGSEELLGLRQ